MKGRRDRVRKMSKAALWFLSIMTMLLLVFSSPVLAGGGGGGGGMGGGMGLSSGAMISGSTGYGFGMNLGNIGYNMGTQMMLGPMGMLGANYTTTNNTAAMFGNLGYGFNMYNAPTGLIMNNYGNMNNWGNMYGNMYNLNYDNNTDDDLDVNYRHMNGNMGHGMMGGMVTYDPTTTSYNDSTTSWSNMPLANAISEDGMVGYMRGFGTGFPSFTSTGNTAAGYWGSLLDTTSSFTPYGALNQYQYQYQFGSIPWNY